MSLVLPSMLGLIGPKNGPVAPVAGMTAWYDASEITGLNDGDPIDTWEDLSGNAHHLTQALTARPTYNTAVQNGLPVVTFDGTSDYMSAGSAPTIFPTGFQHTIFMVLIACIPKVLPNVSFLFDTATAGGLSRRYGQTYVDTGQGKMRIARDGGGGLTDVNMSSGETLLYAGKFDGATSLLRLQADSGRESTWACSTDTAAAQGGMTIGRGVPVSSFFYEGQMGEILIYPSALSDPDFEHNENYLMTKWGL